MGSANPRGVQEVIKSGICLEETQEPCERAVSCHSIPSPVSQPRELLWCDSLGACFGKQGGLEDQKNAVRVIVCSEPPWSTASCCSPDW